MVNLYDSYFMLIALNQAKIAFNKNEVPIGAVVVSNNEIIACSYNQVKLNIDITAHAEVLCIQNAAKRLGTTNLNNCYLYTTLEPCVMCAQVISFSKIRGLYFGAYDIKFGAVENGVRLFNFGISNYIPEIYGGINQKDSSFLMKSFFKKIRKNKNY